MAIPLAGSMGVLFAGWLSDKVFHLRRAPASSIMLLALGFFTWLFPQVPQANWVDSLAVLVMVIYTHFLPLSSTFAALFGSAVQIYYTLCLLASTLCS